ncbi:MAG: M23 family metallopeptidase [Bacteroidia bacterium]|nr:M23 family metallopeptidase [Bacteroidia bacterium]
MAEEQKKRKKIYRKLRNKYRLVIMNDQTLEEKTSLRLSPLNVFVFIGTIILSLITFTIYIIAFTPLREYIPGYTDVNMRKNLVKVTVQADSMAAVLRAQELYFNNLRNIIDGKADIAIPEGSDTSSAKYDTISKLSRSEQDSLLRAEIESQDKFSLLVNASRAPANDIRSFYFFTPVKGTITSEFNPREQHFGIDVVAKPNEAIKATLDGTVIFSDWTLETGYIIGLQHTNNLFSVYKHNSALLKKTGQYVKAGDVIAIIGNSGEFTTGPHLHFELWYNGKAVNPVDFISF